MHTNPLRLRVINCEPFFQIGKSGMGDFRQRNENEDPICNQNAFDCESNLLGMHLLDEKKRLERTRLKIYEAKNIAIICMHMS